MSYRVAGFVLTGGRSSRMGRDKALLPAGRQTLCEQIGDVVASVAEQVWLVGHPERYRHLKYQCVADRHPDLGPLSGVETALSLQRAEFHIVVSCDLYNLQESWLRALLWEAERGVVCAAAEDADGKVQPLCAVYRSGCLGIVQEALSERRLKMMDLLAELGAKRVEVEGVVLNVNTPDQYREIANAD